MDDDDFETTSTPSARRGLRFDLVVLGVHLLDELAGAVHATTTAAFNAAAMHANFLSQQATFHEEAAIEIETLTGEADG